MANASGIGTYSTTVNLPSGWDASYGATLSLGQVTDTFTLTVNGRAVGIDGIDPVVDLGPYLHAGANAISVRVATTYNNRLFALDTAVRNRGVIQNYGLVGPVVLTPYRQAELTTADGSVETLIELPTFAIVAPSNGRTHPSGKPYRRLAGTFSTIASYSAEEREALIRLARSFDEMPAREIRNDAPTASRGTRPSSSPTILNVRTSPRDGACAPAWIRRCPSGPGPRRRDRTPSPDRARTPTPAPARPRRRPRSPPRPTTWPR